MISYFFNWYHGQVWGNLLASAIATSIGLLWSIRHLKKHQDRHHQEQLAHLKEIKQNLEAK